MRLRSRQPPHAPRDLEALARAARIREAAERGIRAVPADPGPDFPLVPFACDVAPARCGDCTARCPDR